MNALYNLILTKILRGLCITDSHVSRNKWLIFSVQFGFWQKYSSIHALINLLDEIRNEIAKGICCGIFLDFQKVFYTIDHHILLTKLEYYGVRGIPINVLFLNLVAAVCFKRRKEKEKRGHFLYHSSCPKGNFFTLVF